MSTTPKATGSEAETLEQRFERLAEQWLVETSVISSITQIVAHPAFQEIVGMGEEAIPLVLRAMEKQGGQWDLAMTRIAGFNPVPLNERGNVRRAREVWLQWGKEQGYQW